VSGGEQTNKQTNKKGENTLQYSVPEWRIHTTNHAHHWVAQFWNKP